MKSMKKLVLAGLVLLASVMVLVGCKNAVEPSGVDEIIVPEGSSGIDEIVPVLTFSADSEQTLTVKILGKYTLHESLQYAVGSGEWQKLEADKAITFGGATGSLRMRGKSARGMAKDETLSKKDTSALEVINSILSTVSNGISLYCSFRSLS